MFFKKSNIKTTLVWKLGCRVSAFLEKEGGGGKGGLRNASDFWLCHTPRKLARRDT